MVNVIYRIFSLFINFIAAMLAISLVFSIPALISSPLTLLSAFIIVAIILYTYNSYKFFRNAVVREEAVPASLRDWVRVNGIVSLIFCLILLIEIPVLLQQPQLYTEALQSFGGQVPEGSIQSFFIVMLVYAIVLIVHILMTFRMMRLNKHLFQ